MEIKRVGSQARLKGRQTGLLAQFVSIRCFRHPILRLFRARALRLSRVHELHGIRIRSARRSSLRLAAVGRSVGPVEEIRPGDVVWFSPGEKHWHGATPMTAMTHIAIQEKKDGNVVEWMEHVSDEQYRNIDRECNRVAVCC